jgi:hypothetical protein
MSNSLNITASNFNFDSSKRFLGDVTVSIAIIDDQTKAAGDFHSIGYCDPEKTFSSKRDYAEFVAGMPETVIAKDVTKITNTFKAKLKQFQAETFALVCGAYLDTTGTDKRVVFGTEIPAPLNCSMILSGKTKDGKAMELYIRKLQIAPETIDLAIGSKEYGTLNFEAAIVPDENPLVTNWSWPMRGLKICPDDGATVDYDTKEISLASTTGWEVGMRVYSKTLGFLGIIESIVPNTKLVLDRNPPADGINVQIKGVTHENMVSDNIAFFKFQI